MNLKLKLVARTSNSEAISIFDTDVNDENGSPVNIGKLDMHFVDDQIVGTLLIWQEYATGYSRTHGPGSDETLDTLIDEILTEATEPLGIPSEYGIEVYYPSVTNHSFISNYAGDEEGEEPEDGEEGEDSEFEEQIRRYGGAHGG